MTHLITINGVMALGTTIPFLLKLAPYGATTPSMLLGIEPDCPSRQEQPIQCLTESSCYGQIFNLLFELLFIPFFKCSNSKATLVSIRFIKPHRISSYFSDALKDS
jgi:hypothetical protein